MRSRLVGNRPQRAFRERARTDAVCEALMLAQPALHVLLMDALAQAGDPVGDRTPLDTAFADAEIYLIARLRDLINEDEHARAFVRRWPTLVETTDDYPQRRGARLPSSGDVQVTIGAQRLRAAVTLFDAFVRDDVAKTYRVLGTVVEESGDADAESSSPRSVEPTP